MSRVSVQPLPDSPNPASIGSVGALYFAEDPLFRVRHVETVVIEDDRNFKRHLTIDLELPSDPRFLVDDGTGDPTWWVPLALLPKAPPASNIDLRDERGQALPLLLRQENAEITAQMLSSRFEELRGAPPSPLLADLLRDLAYLANPWALLALAIVRDQAAAQYGPPPTDDAWQQLTLLMEELVTTSIVWSRFKVSGGLRRIVKLAIDASAEIPDLRLTRYRGPVRRETVALDVDDTTFVLTPPAISPEPVNRTARRIIRNLWRRIMVSCAIRDFNWGIEDLYITGPRSFHMQIPCPPGLRIADMRLDPQPDSSIQGRGFVCETSIDLTDGHLHVANATLPPGVRIAVSLRVARRGFLSLVTVSAIGIAAILWIFALRSHWATHDSGSMDVAGATLLVAPALIALFALRPGEHALATRMLVGLQGLIAFSGFVSVLAAAALAGVHFKHVGLATTWKFYASITSAVALITVLAWIRALEVIDKARRGDVPAGIAAVSSRLDSPALQLGVALAPLPPLLATIVWANPTGSVLATSRWIGLLLVLAGSLAVIALKLLHGRQHPPASAFAGLFLILTAALVPGLFGVAANGWSVAEQWRVILWVAIGGFGVGLILEGIWLWRTGT